ncbi:hypothetical protein, partial [Pseudomonas syringae group genomosp. 7]|uniref:hypothetical protein n=1 Tax=Pseudomonas syringae group genomosp. 7 TaxID=251699 RepID=UPI0037703876
FFVVCFGARCFVGSDGVVLCACCGFFVLVVWLVWCLVVVGLVWCWWGVVCWRLWLGVCVVFGGGVVGGCGVGVFVVFVVDGRGVVIA